MTTMTQHAAGMLCWCQIGTTDPEAAKKFYGSLFGWKIEPFRGMPDFLHIDTGGGDGTPDGGMMKRKSSQHTVTNYVNVESVDESAAKVEKLGGKICMAKTAVPEMGYFVICQDPENNTFALWEVNDQAK